MNKKKKRKKLWIGLGVVVVFFLLCSLFAEPEEGTAAPQTADEPATTQTADEPATAQTAQSEPAEAPQEASSAVEAYELLAENATTPFTISEQAKQFITDHPDFFPGSESIAGAMSDYLNWELTYPMLNKNAQKYGDCLYEIYGYVVDIEEIEGKWTYLHLSDYDGKSYILFYLGLLDDVYEEDEVTSYALPFDVVTFENMGGTYTEAIAMGGCYVDKFEME